MWRIRVDLRSAFAPVWASLTVAFFGASAPVFADDGKNVAPVLFSWNATTRAENKPAYYVATLGSDGLPSRIIDRKFENSPRPLASISKVMTVYLAIEAMKKRGDTLEHVLNLEDLGFLNESKFAALKSEKCRLGDAISGTFVQSNNYLANALARYVAGSEEAFVALMN